MSSYSTGRSTVSIDPAARIDGDFRLPGDKSISHRSAMFASLGGGRSRIDNYSTARDCQNTLDCLAALGVRYQRQDSTVTIEGIGLEGFTEAHQTLDAGNSGTSIRLLSGILAGQPFTTEIGGDESLSRRPMRRIIEPLALMGAQIEARDGTYPPLRISGGNLRAIEYRPSMASAQVKTCVLLAGLFADGETTIIEATPTRNHTEIMLRECGAALKIRSDENGERITIPGRQPVAALGDYTVAGDISSAAFFLIAALVAPAGELRLRHIGVNPSRAALIDVLAEMGGQIAIENARHAHGEPVADLVARSSSLSGKVELSAAVIANMIDEIPILTIAGTQINGSMTIRGAGELRVKESDRIRAIVDNLRLMGVTIEEFEDGFHLDGPQQLRGARVSSYGDHRIAMAFAVAGLIAKGETVIDGAEAASVSLPEFYSLLSAAGAPVKIGS
jgi:3-phosphoshikimate 1-carboxyvinyltransferase